jgi:hypothetical protein
MLVVVVPLAGRVVVVVVVPFTVMVPLKKVAGEDL